MAENMNREEEQPDMAVRRRYNYKTPVIYETIEEPTMLRELIEDDIYLFGGHFAILCQFAHPALAAGTAAHSSFAGRVGERLRNTTRFLNAAVYGTERDQAAIFSVIHGFHARVRGLGYDANDPELHRWTAATLFVSLVVVHECFFGALSPERMRSLYRQSAVFGTSLRMPPELWPATIEDFWRYWDESVAKLRVTDAARELATHLLYPTGLPPRMAAAMPLSRLLTRHWLPEKLAREYRLEPTSLSRVAYAAVVRLIAVVYPLLPASIRQSWHRHYMEDLKRAVANIERTGHWVEMKNGA